MKRTWPVLLSTIIILIAMLFYSYGYLNRILPTVMVPGLTQKFHINITDLGILSAYFYWAYTLMQLPTGILFDRYGVRNMMLTASLAVTLGSFMFALGPSLWVAEMGRFVIGFGASFAFIGVLKLAVIWMPFRYFAIISGLTSSVGLVGAMLSVIGAAKLVQLYGTTKTSLVIAAIGIIITLLMFIFIKDREKTVDNEPEHMNSFKQVLQALVQMLKNPHIWINGVIGFCLYLPINCFAALWGVPYLKKAFMMSTSTASWAITTLIIGFAIGGPLIAWLSNSIERRKAPLIICCFCSGLAFLVLIYGSWTQVSAVFVILFILGFFSSAQALVFPIAHEYTVSTASGTATSLTNMFMTFGGTLFLPLVGFLMDIHNTGITAGLAHTKLANSALTLHTSDYQFAFTLLPMLTILAGIAGFFLKETYGKPLHLEKAL